MGHRENANRINLTPILESLCPRELADPSLLRTAGGVAASGQARIVVFVARGGDRSSLRADGDRLYFGSSVALSDAVACRRATRAGSRRGQTGFTFDFSRTTYASHLAMAQLVVHAEACRRRDMHFDVIDPKDRTMRRIFENSNWAHHLSPVNYEPREDIPATWLPVMRYTTDEELLRLVDGTLWVVLGQATIKRSALHGLEWALNEMADNVFQHADSPHGGLIAVMVAAKRSRIQFVVADSGRGIPDSIRTGHEDLDTDPKALRHAMKQGVTRDRSVGAGNGLAGALRIATATNGRFSLFSGRGLLVAQADRPRPTARSWSETSALEGTVVSFEMDVHRDFDLEAALLEDGISIADWDYLDATYEPDDHDIRLLVVDEVTSTATRVGGEPLRRKARNLVSAHPSAKVVLDFAGVDRVTSSFADEVVGKLLVSLGPSRFGERVVLEGLDEGLVQGQVKRVLTQRSDEARMRRREKLR
ncbi:MAG: STAS-like domain-containing protein [Solirubrobacterales bacterium]